jgi:hypothetical protein
MWGFACQQFAMLGVAEALLGSDEEKNRLFPPISYWDSNEDYLSSFLANMANERGRAAHPALAAWAKTSRLSPLGNIGQHSNHPVVIETREKIKQYGAAAAGKLMSLLRSP